MRILWSPQSLRDLDAMHGYIAKDSGHYAGLSGLWSAHDNHQNSNFLFRPR